MDFHYTYKKAESPKEKVWCAIAKILHAKYVTPFGRIILLSKDYERMEKQMKLE